MRGSGAAGYGPAAGMNPMNAGPNLLSRFDARLAILEICRQLALRPSHPAN